jgi:hypothetical protein
MSRFSIVRCCQAGARHARHAPGKRRVASRLPPAALSRLLVRCSIDARLRFSDLIVPISEIA